MQSQMLKFLESVGLDSDESTIVVCVWSVWRAIDWDSLLWKTAGKDLYNRFESRIRASAREKDIKSFLARLCRKCHVSVPRMDDSTFKMIASADNNNSLKFARTQSGTIVAAMRAYKDDSQGV